MDVSVIIPALNAEKTIERAVRSAMGQTLASIEIVVVDDGSADATSAIVTGLAREDTRVRLIQSAQRQGVSAARNKAIAAASGAWFAVLDADDWFASDRLAVLTGHGRDHGLDAVIDNLNRIDARTGKDLGPAFPPEWLASDTPMSPSFPVIRDVPNRQKAGFGYCKPVFRRASFLEKVGCYDEDLRCSEDLLALQLLLFRGGLVGTVCKSLYFYSVDPGSLSNKLGIEADISNANRKMTREAKKNGLRDVASFLQNRQTIIDYDYFSKLFKQGRYRLAVMFLSRMPFGIVALQILRIAARGLRLDLAMLDPRSPHWLRSRPWQPIGDH